MQKAPIDLNQKSNRRKTSKKLNEMGQWGAKSFWQPVLLEKCQKAQIPCIPPLSY